MNYLLKQARELAVEASHIEERARQATTADPADLAAAYEKAAKLRVQSEQTYRAAGYDHS